MEKNIFSPRGHRHIWPLLVVVLLLLGGAAIYAFRSQFGTQENALPVLLKDEVIVLRTPGGMLEVATLVRNEEYKWKTEYSCPILNCGAIFGRTISDLRVPVHYTYRVPLAAEWRLQARDAYLELIAPREQAKLPAAVELSKLQIHTQKGWLAPSTATHRESLLRHLGPELDARASRKEYIEAQRSEARRTVAEFARKWMVEQGVDKRKAAVPIPVRRA
jgi:hypothetical protein